MGRPRVMLSRALWLMALVPPVVGGCNQIFDIEPSATGSSSTSTGTGGATSASVSSATGTSSASSVTGTGGSTSVTGTGSSTGTGGSGGTAPTSFLLGPAGGPSTVPDGTSPFETHSISLTRSKAGTKLVLSSMADGTGALYVDDNVHVVVTPTVGSPADQYYQFWTGFACPAASTTLPPGGTGSGISPPIDVSFLFSTDTTSPQMVTLEFWHCASHIPAPHSDFYLVEL